MGKEASPEKVVQEIRRKTPAVFGGGEVSDRARVCLASGAPTPRGEHRDVVPEEGHPEFCTTARARNVWTPGRRGSSAIRAVKVRPPKSRICGRRTPD